MTDSFRNPHYLADAKESIKDGNIIISPNKLNIVWGGDSRYWNIPVDEHDKKPAELRQVCWLEVTTTVEKIDPRKTYEVGFNISFTPDAFGWGADYPVYFMTKRGKNGKASWKKIVLDVSDQAKDIKRQVDARETTSDGGEKTSDNDEVYFGFYEVWSGKWKGGLRIYHAFVKEV